jgi:hypothetical protein
MRLSFLDPLYAQPGPYASGYLDTSRDIDDPEKAIELRRRHAREELSRHGADEATIAALEEAVGTDRDVPGRHGQAVFATHGRIALMEELPEPPAHDTARFGVLPDAMPLAIQHAPDIAYAAVAVGRLGEGDEVAERAETGETEETEATGERESGVGQADLEADVEFGTWPMSKVTPGPRTRRRVPSEGWPQAAAEIVGELEQAVERTGTEVVLVRGGLWPRGVLLNRMPRRLRDRVVAIEDDGRPAADHGRALLEEDLNELFRGRMSARDEALAETFLAQRARGRGAAEGLVAVVAAVQRGQARALLLDPSADLSVRVWVGPEPTQLALSREDLRSFGVRSIEEQAAGAALIRGLVGTGAELVVVPGEDVTMEGRLGVLLRYTDPGTR